MNPTSERQSPTPIDPLLTNPLVEGFVGDIPVPASTSLPPTDPLLTNPLSEEEQFVGDIPVPTRPSTDIPVPTLSPAAATGHDVPEDENALVDFLLNVISQPEDVGTSQAETSGPATSLPDIPVNMSYDGWLSSRMDIDTGVSQTDDNAAAGLEHSIDPTSDAPRVVPNARTAATGSLNRQASKKVIKPPRSIEASANAQKLHKNPLRTVTKDAVVPHQGPSRRISVQCPECEQLILKKNLDRHMASKHQGIRYLCPVCEKPLSFRGDVKRHMAAWHPTDPRSSDAPDLNTAFDVIHGEASSGSNTASVSTGQLAGPAPRGPTDFPAAPEASTSGLAPPSRRSLRAQSKRSTPASATTQARKTHKNPEKATIKAVQHPQDVPLKPSQVICDECGKVLHKNSLARHRASQHKGKK